MQPYPLPEAFLKKMHFLLKDEYEAFLASYSAPSCRALRLNPLKGDLNAMLSLCAAKFQLTPVPWAKEGFYYEENTHPGRHPYHDAGLYYIQEPSAMAPASLLFPCPGDYVLDLCAAPGGKSTQIAARLKGQGFLLSNEIHPARAKILSQNIERMGIANAAVTCEDSESLARHFPEFFDKIMVDAPCSGEGMFRRDENARGEWSLKAPALCQSRQQEILDQGAKMLKPGGQMVYSTCTFSPEENEESIALFLESHPDFFLLEGGLEDGFQDFSRGNPAWISEEKTGDEAGKAYRAWPHRIKGEGHFFALLKKEGAGEGKENIRDPKGNIGGKQRKTPWEKGKDPGKKKAFEEFLAETLEGFGKKEAPLPWEAMPGRYLLFGEQLYYVHQAFCPEGGMKILRPGLHLGTFKPNRFEPSHALALFLKPDQVKRADDFPGGSREIAGYLRGESLPAAGAEGKGWGLITVDGFSLGWAKQVGGILKNHYPKGLRRLS